MSTNTEVKIPSERLLFGQYLIDYNRKVTRQLLQKAVKLQENDKSHRKLGVILWKEFNVFESEMELVKALQTFEKYKARMSRIYKEAQAISKLNNEELQFDLRDIKTVFNTLDFFILNIQRYSEQEINEVLIKMRDVHAAVADRFGL